MSDNNEIILTEEQKKFIDANWDKMNLKELTQVVFKNDKLTGLTREGRAIKAYIAQMNPDAKIKTTKYEKGDNAIQLTEEQKEFVRNNIHQMKWLEMAQILFGNERMSRLHTEAKAVYNYCLEIDSTSIPEDEKMNEDEYRAPTSIARLVPRVNLNIKKNMESGKFLNPDDLKPQEKKYLEALLGYMNTYRFIYQMNVYKNKTDRELAESTFIRHCWGKDDLQEEEVDRYISLMEAIVETAKIQKTKEILEEKLRTWADDSVEGKKLSMSLVEAVNSQRESLKEATTRTEKLMSNLIDSRADRLKKKIERTAAFINFFELWRKEESRKPLILLAQARQEKLKEEVKRLSDMDALMAEIYGLDEDTITQ